MIKKISILALMLLLFSSCQKKTYSVSINNHLEYTNEESKMIIEAYEKMDVTRYILTEYPKYGMPQIAFKENDKYTYSSIIATGIIDMAMVDPYDEFFDVIGKISYDKGSEICNEYHFDDLFEFSKSEYEKSGLYKFESADEEFDFKTYYAGEKTTLNELYRYVFGIDIEDNRTLLEFIEDESKGDYVFGQEFFYKDLKIKVRISVETGFKYFIIKQNIE